MNHTKYLKGGCKGLCIVVVLVACFFLISAKTNDETEASVKKATSVSTENTDIIPQSEDVLVTEIEEKKPEQFILVNGKIDKKTLYEELRKESISAAEIISLLNSFKGVFDFKYSVPGDRYELKLTQEKSIKEFSYKPDLRTVFTAVKNAEGSFEVSQKDIKPDIIVKSCEFLIESSLYKAILKGGEKGDLAAQLTDLFSWDIDFYLYPRKNDKILMIYEKEFIDGHFCGYGKILAAKYMGAKETFSAYYFKDGQGFGYYDENGHPLKKMFLRIPVKVGVQTSPFSIRRFHPISKKYKAHTGIDYGARKGTKIFATANGVVTFSGWMGGYGKLVVVQHPNGYKTYYGHCNSLIAKKGDYVEQGQVIARVGETGIATGPHVHYEVRINNKPINPNLVKSNKGKPVSEENIERFRTLVQNTDQSLYDMAKEVVIVSDDTSKQDELL